MTIGIVLADLPAALLDSAVSHLGDVLRECQLVLVDRARTEAFDPDLAELASGLVPDLEELQDLFATAEVRVEGDRTRLAVDVQPTHAALFAHLTVLLDLLRHVGRRGGLLVTDDPEVNALLGWIWDEVGAQMHGRTARSFPR